jgi:hypothetical protein
MGQLGIKSDLFFIQYINLTCQYDYTLLHEEKCSFESEWLNERIQKKTLHRFVNYLNMNQLINHEYICLY